MPSPDQLLLPSRRRRRLVGEGPAAGPDDPVTDLERNVFSAVKLAGSTPCLRLDNDRYLLGHDEDANSRG